MYERIKNITSLILNKLGATRMPEIGIVMGSGLGDLASAIEIEGTMDYAAIDGFARSTVAGHQGRFVYGKIAGRQVIAMQGRVHYYEGYPIEQVVLPIRVMCQMGIKIMVVSNAAGGVSEDFAAGDLMAITDHINMLPNPLIGPNIEQMGPRFLSMNDAYDPKLIKLALDVARRQGLTLRQGVYVGWSGPTFETQAEYQYLRTIGAHATGMSTTPEVIVARHCGVRVFGMSLISNVALGAHATIPSHQEVQQVAAQATANMSNLILGMIDEMY